MKEQLEELRKEFNERIDKLIKPKPEFEVGKWYKSGRGLMIYSGDIDNCAGFWGGQWDYNWTIESDDEPIRPATESEVKEALIKEAEKKQYNGNKITLIAGRVGETSEKLTIRKYEYHAKTDELRVMIDGTAYHTTYTIYKQGRWAEIVKDTLTLGGKKVKRSCVTGRVLIGPDRDLWTLEELNTVEAFLTDHPTATAKELQIIINKLS